MPFNPGISWRRVGNILLIVHASRDPADAEWTEFVGSRELESGCVGCVVVANGARPSPKQRLQLQARAPKVRISVLSDSPLTRGAVTALRWLGMPIRAFSPNAMKDAFDHVGLPSAAFTVATSALDEMSREVGIKPNLAAHG